MTVAITASMIKELRDSTGAPMGDCKKALTEAKGDLKAAAAELGLTVAALKKKLKG